MPVRDGGDPGGTQERVMLGAVGDLSGILRREDDNLDGTTTTLFTRRGRPVFETSTARSRATEVLYRGFVAKNPQTGYAVLFDPYTLTILRSSFSPAKPSYYVQNFATTWGVPPADATNWYDVAMFDGTAVKINAKAMPTLQVVANHSFPAIPYVIERSDPANRYGGPDQNNTEKRVFAVGRADVQEWGSSSVGSVQTLTPTTPRTDGKALTIGQRIDDTSDTAWLGQIYYTGAAWDSSGGGWYFTSAEVQMLLTAAYLVKVAGNANVDMSPPTLVNAGTASAPRGTSVTLPTTPIALRSNDSRIVQSNQNLRILYWYWDATFSSPLQAQEYGNNTRLTYSGSSSATETQAGMGLSYSCSNVKTWDDRSIGLVMYEQYIPIAAAGQYASYSGLSLDADATTLFWGDTYAPLRGRTQVWVDDYLISPPGGNPTRYYETQVISGYVETSGAVRLVEFSATRDYSYGGAYNVTPNTTHYDSYMGDASTYPGQTFGMGIYGRLELNAAYYPASDIIPVNDYYKQYPSPPPNQTPAVLAEIDAEFDAKAVEYQTQTYYDCENSDGDSRYNFYTTSVNASVIRNDRALTWQTRDFILFDEDNGVYISIEGAFSASGHPATGTLTVTAKVETRHHTTTIQLGQWSYTYTELLPEREIGSTGKYAVPSPQIRAIFAPLYQEQGSFHGAHYVTADEESNGADPFHGFNFLLRLGTYGDFSTCNENNAENKDVYFVPCNLLEMLYAFVFSTEMGVAESGDRYPVTYASRYTQLVNELFIAHRISVSDGVQANWTDQLGPQFSSISNTTLHRV